MTAVKIRQEDIIACTPVESKKIYIREETGHFQKIRRYLNVVLVTLFVALPFIQYQGQQAILFDVGRQTLTLFAWVLYPQDLMIFAFLFILAAFVLFLVTRHYGRRPRGFGSKVVDLAVVGKRLVVVAAHKGVAGQAGLPG